MESQDDPHRKKKRPNITIREMDIDDLATVFHLGEQLFKARHVPNLYRTWDEFEVIELFNSDSEFCLVAEVGEKMVGFALGTTITKNHSAWKYGQLAWLGVDPCYHRYGIATRLFNQFLELMRKNGVRMLLVDTEADNLPALHFFRKLGFGNPEEHVYLTLNIAKRQRMNGKVKKASPLVRSPVPNGKTTDE